MIKLLNEVREIKRKILLPTIREGYRGEIVSPIFTERETELMIEMLTRRSKIHSTPGGHIFPTKMKGTRANSTQQRAMELIRKGEWVI
jgi:hypothetical protein